MSRAATAANRFQARADRYLSTADAQAQRIADGWNEPPANSHKLTTDEIRQLWSYSPSEQPEQDFWAMHDQVLQQNLAQLGPQADQQALAAAHGDAEQQALAAIYPNRAQLAGLGATELEEQVKRADQIKRLVEGQQEDTPHA